MTPGLHDNDMCRRSHGVRRRLRVFAYAIAAAFSLCLGAFAVAWVVLPGTPEGVLNPPASAAVTDASGCLLMQTVARDDQWRFPVPLSEISPWLIQATIAVEDERFASHPGVDPIAAARAALQNLSSLRIRSGASTLTMQLVRMADPRPRSWWAKAAQTVQALKLDRRLDKDAQLACYFNLAPYGGNICGAEAASRIYFNKHAADLTLAEAALLAGLPQSPSRYRPDRHPDRALARRSVVLGRMLELAMISSHQYEAAQSEPVRLADPPPANIAPHFADMVAARRATGGATRLRRALQLDMNRLAEGHVRSLPNGSDAAIVVIEIATGDVVALVGGTREHDPRTGRVNGATARRSPGSALKPFIYAAAMDAGMLDPQTLVYDIPIDRDGWTPDNFDRVNLGPLPAAQALRRSRNVPAILISEAVGPPRCAGLLEALGVRISLGRTEAAGLALATGAVEVSLLDLTNAYAAIGRGGEYVAPRIFDDDPLVARPALSQRACDALDEMLSCTLRRPRVADEQEPGETAWFMWKTGTSSGRRDAWAVGHNRHFAAGVWIGRLEGGGHTAQVGARAAEPLLARIFALPAIRNDQPPPPAATWHAARPMPAPPELDAPLQILSPTADATFIATGGPAAIPIRANRALETAVWFLDGRMIRLFGERTVLDAEPGRHELTCRDDRNRTARVSFQVEATHAIATGSR